MLGTRTLQINLRTKKEKKNEMQMKERWGERINKSKVIKKGNYRKVRSCG
jgi:hypothetical protein